MATSGTGRHSRLCTILVKVGTPVSRALFKKRVEELRPQNHSSSTWTLTQFLQLKRRKIESSKIGRSKRTIIYPIVPHTTQLENWDLYLICSMLIECCELDSNIKLFVVQLRKLRNKLFHMSEPTIDDDKYDHYLTKLKVIFNKCLIDIKDDSFSEEIRTMIKSLEEGSLHQNDIDEVMEKLRSMQDETNEQLSKIGQNQHITNAKLDTVLEKLQLLTANIPALNSLQVPESNVEIAITNCSQERESDISKVLVDNFNNIVKSDPVLHKEISELSNESQQKIRDAVHKTYEMFISTGCEIIDAEEGCVRLTLQWTSLNPMIRFYQDCMSGKLTKRLLILEEAVRTLDGCDDVKLTAIIDVDRFSSTVDNLVTDIEEFLGNEGGKPLLPSTIETAEYDIISKPVTEGDKIRNRNVLKLRIRSNHSQDAIKLQNLFKSGDVDIVTKNLQDTVRNEFKTPDVLLTTQLADGRSSNKHEFLKSAYNNQTAEFSELKQSAVKDEEETAAFTRNEKRDIKLGTEYRFDSWRSEESHSPLEKPDLVIAIDVGNYASGFVIQTRSDFLEDPLKITLNAKSSANELCTYKTTTCLLLKPDKTIADFGYNAESRFNFLGEDDDENPQDWYFFKHFKKELNQEQIQGTGDGTPIMGAYGKSLPAVEVFSKTIEYLRKQAVECINQNGIPFCDVDTKWLLTVPGMYSESAKQVMQHAAVKAGINVANLTLALESECAAIYCSKLPADQLGIQGDGGKLKFAAAQDNTIMVVDMGGGNVSVTTVQIKKDLTLKEVYVSGGGPWGGMTVDESFMMLLKEMIGSNVIESFIENFPMDEYELRMEFETKKKEIKHSSESSDDEHVLIKLPQSLQDLCEKLNGKKINEILNGSTYESITFAHGRLSVHADIMRNFFRGTLTKILDYISDVLKNTDHDRINIDSIILTGGFAESHFVVQSMRESLREYGIPVVRLEASEMAVLNGAVIFGHNETVIISRIMPLTYGVAMIMEFDRKRHNSKETFIADGKVWANNVFQKYVTKGQEIKLCDVVVAKEYYTAEVEQLSATVLMYSSDKRDPIHTSDPGCRLIGKVEIDEMPIECEPDLQTEPWSRSRVVEVAMSFVGLDVKVKAFSKILGRVYEKYLRIK